MEDSPSTSAPSPAKNARPGQKLKLAPQGGMRVRKKASLQSLQDNPWTQIRSPEYRKRLYRNSISPFSSMAKATHRRSHTVEDRPRCSALYRLWSHCIIRPQNKLKFTFDLLVIFLIFWVGGTLPPQVAFGIEFVPGLDALAEMVFVADFVLSFFHGHFNTGVEILEPEKVARHYMSKGRFWADLISAIPFGFLSGGNLRTLSLLKTIRVWRIRRVIGRYSYGIRSSVIFRLLLTILIQVLFVHFSACAFYALGYYSVCSFPCALDVTRCTRVGASNNRTAGVQNNLSITSSWNLAYWPELDTHEFCVPDLSIRGGGGDVIPASTRYVHALAWAFATVSSLPDSSAPHPVNNLEYTLAFICNVVGGVVLAAVIGNVSKLLVQHGAKASRYKMLHDEIRAFAKASKLDTIEKGPELRNRLHAYMNFRFSVNEGHNLNETISKLPYVVHRDVLFAIYTRILSEESSS